MMQSILPDSSRTCFVVPGLFSAEECAQLLTPEIQNGFQKAAANYPTYYRNNDRLLLDDEVLAKWLFQKVRPWLPDTICTDGPIPAENGVWNVLGLNSRLRYCRYAAQQYFHRHLDGVHYRSETVQSKLTFMIYLNSASDFRGGRTLFYKSRKAAEVWAAYTPVQGDLILFDHNVWHEGEALTAGEKFVLRSDVLYTRLNGSPQPQPFGGHLGYIWSLLVWDENTLLSGGRDKEIKVWTQSGTFMQSLRGHENSILCMEKMSESVFISGSRDQTIRVWKDFSLHQTLRIHTAAVLSLCSLDAETFASGGGDARIHICDLNGQVCRTLDGHTDWVWQVIRLATGVLASCSEDGTVRIWDTESGRVMHIVKGCVPQLCLAYDAGQRCLLTGNLSGEVSLYLLGDDYRPMAQHSFHGHQGLIRTIHFLDAGRFVTGGEDHTVRIWSLGGEKLREMQHQNFVQALAMPDRHRLFSASYDGTIQEWVV